MSASPIETDALVIGAGPVGLFQAFQLGLLEIGCHIVDALPRAGGQCTKLYGDKPIYDIPGTPRTTGNGLVASLLEQIAPFHVQLHLGEQVATLNALSVSRPLAQGDFAAFAEQARSALQSTEGWVVVRQPGGPQLVNTHAGKNDPALASKMALEGVSWAGKRNDVWVSNLVCNGGSGNNCVLEKPQDAFFRLLAGREERIACTACD